MRRKDRAIPEDQALAIVDKCDYAVLATVDEEGRPYGIPLTIVREGRGLYFHCAPGGRKISHMKSRPEVSLACVGRTHIPEGEFTIRYESAVVSGPAREVDSVEEKKHALRLLCLRHTPDNMDKFEDYLQKLLPRTAVWRVEITSLTGKSNHR